MSRSPVFDDAALAEAALKFVATLHRTGGYTKEEIRNAFHPKMINAYFDIINKKQRDPDKGSNKP